MHQLKADAETTPAIRPIKLVPQSVRRRRPRIPAPLNREPAPIEARTEDRRL